MIMRMILNYVMGGVLAWAMYFVIAVVHAKRQKVDVNRFGECNQVKAGQTLWEQGGKTLWMAIFELFFLWPYWMPYTLFTVMKKIDEIAD